MGMCLWCLVSCQFAENVDHFLKYSDIIWGVYYIITSSIYLSTCLCI